MALRILCIADTPPDPDSGAAGTDWQGVAALRRAGHEVVDLWGDALPRRISHYNLRYLLELPAAYANLVDRELRKTRYDVVQISQPHGYAAARLVHRHHPGSVFVHRSHGFEARVGEALAPWMRSRPDDRPMTRRIASTGMARLLRFNWWAIARWAHGHIVSGRECASCLERRYRVPASSIACIPQGVSTAYLAPARAASEERLRRILHVAQLAYFKAPMILANAVSTAMRADESLTFTWVCARNHHAEALSMMAPEVRSRVTLLDWMPQQELREVYDSHGIFVFPSFFEGFGKALIEAMSRGLVVIASDAVAAAELIEQGRNGWRVPVGDSPAIVDRIREAIARPAESRAMAGLAANDAQRLTWDAYAEAAGVFFDRLLQARRGAVPGGAWKA